MRGEGDVGKGEGSFHLQLLLVILLTFCIMGQYYNH